MEISARRAEADDLVVVVALCTAGHAELRPNRGGEIWSQWEARPEPLDASIAATAADSSSRLIVGTIDETIVGYAAVTLTPLHDGRIVGHLTDLYVMADARGVGVGESLMGEVIDWGRSEGCVGIDSIALPGDRHTKNFFESFGMVARALRVHRSL